MCGCGRGLLWFCFLRVLVGAWVGEQEKTGAMDGRRLGAGAKAGRGVWVLRVALRFVCCLGVGAWHGGRERGGEGAREVLALGGWVSRG